jgi:hypothetical protein
VLAAAIAAGATSVVLLGGWRGADYPAQLYRVDLARRYGLVWWNSQWYGGHSTAGYSVVFPLVGAAVGVGVVALASSTVAAWCFGAMGRRHLDGAWRAASYWFALATATNVLVGRLTFAAGTAVALAAVLALDRGVEWLAVGLALLCPLVSPVAAAFLALAALAIGVVEPAHRRTAAVMLVGVLGPVLFIGWIFPDGGVMPFSPGNLAWNLATCAVFIALVPREHSALRLAAVFYALANLVAYLMPSPLGMNIGRLGQYLAGPLLVGTVLGRRRRWLAVVVPAMLLWQCLPAIDAVTDAERDPSAGLAYHTPLLQFLRSAGEPWDRVEIPFTLHHWESYYVAREVPLARGWERQLDRTYHPIFYEGSIESRSYQRWLLDNRVRWVALPDVALDASARGEARLLERGLPYLRPVFADRHWRVWEVDGAHPIVDGPARLVSIGPTGIELDVLGPGPIDVGVRYSPRWALTGVGCVEAGPGGWVRLRNLSIGPVSMEQALTGTQCPRAAGTHRPMPSPPRHT